jgi:hypothetical protein
MSTSSTTKLTSRKAPAWVPHPELSLGGEDGKRQRV